MLLLLLLLKISKIQKIQKIQPILRMLYSQTPYLQGHPETLLDASFEIQLDTQNGFSGFSGFSGFVVVVIVIIIIVYQIRGSTNAITGVPRCRQKFARSNSQI